MLSPKKGKKKKNYVGRKGKKYKTKKTCGVRKARVLFPRFLEYC